MACIEARGLRKTYGTTVAVNGIDLRVEEGRILGLIGPNGAGKTTALNAFLGLTPYQGQLRVLGRDPWTSRDHLMRDVALGTSAAPTYFAPVEFGDHLIVDGGLAATTLHARHTRNGRREDMGPAGAEARLSEAVALSKEADR